MKTTLLTPCLLAASIFAATGAQAADIRFNGFASVVGGMTTSEGDDNLAGRPSGFTADAPTQAIYDDDFSFKPDTNFGLQVSANLGDGLSVTGQFTGAGGEDFDAQVSWAYISYDLNDSWTVLAGRQRIPFFFYSDFLDVGYAYHWIRPPVETNVSVDSLDGIQFRYQGSMGSWDTRVQVYGGTSDSTTTLGGNSVDLGLEDAVGVVFYANNDWLQLRATHMVADFFLEAPGSNQTDSDPVGVDFSGIAAHGTFGNGFVVAEYMTYTFDDPVFAAAWDKYEGAYISAGYRFGDVTPHITYSTADQSLIGFAGSINGDEGSEAVTVGVRWDFHPQAAFKVEYTSRSDESDAAVKAIKGEPREVDVVTLGFDVLF